MRQRLSDLARAMGAREPRRLGDKLALLIDGAYGLATTLGAEGLKRQMLDTARLIIDAQLKSRGR